MIYKHRVNYMLSHLIFWWGNFPLMKSFCKFLGDSSENPQKLIVTENFITKKLGRKAFLLRGERRKISLNTQ